MIFKKQQQPKQVAQQPQECCKPHDPTTRIVIESSPTEGLGLITWTICTEGGESIHRVVEGSGGRYCGIKNLARAVFGNDCRVVAVELGKGCARANVAYHTSPEIQDKP